MHDIVICVFLVFVTTQLSSLSIAFDILDVGRQMSAIRNGRVAKPIRGSRKMYALIIEEKSVQWKKFTAGTN